MKSVLRSLPWLATAMVLVISGCHFSSRPSSQAVVSVNSHQLSAGRFADQLASRLRRHDALSVKSPVTIEQAKESVIREFIIHALVQNWAKKNSVILKKETLDEEEQRIKSMYPDSQAFQQMLANEKLDLSTWREALRSSLLERLVAQKLSEKALPPSEEEVAKFYQKNKEQFERPEQVRIRQILLATEADAQRILDELRKGKSFEDLAENHSISPEGKQSKGNLGWLPRGISEIFDSGFNMSIGSRSEIIKGPFGYHIIQVLGKRPAKTLTLAEARPQITRTLLANRDREIFSLWLEDQLRTAQVLYNEDLIKAIVIETKGIN